MNVTYSEIILSLAGSLATRFDEVYHSAELITIDDNKFVGVDKGTEWIDLSPTDQTAEVLYIRRNGDDYARPAKLSSCSVAFEIETPLRIVYFKDNATNTAAELFNLLQTALVPYVKLRSIVRDKFALSRSESSGNYNFGPDTTYIALDVLATWMLQTDTCEQDLCLTVDNPFKACS